VLLERYHPVCLESVGERCLFAATVQWLEIRFRDSAPVWMSLGGVFVCVSVYVWLYEHLCGCLDVWMDALMNA